MIDKEKLGIEEGKNAEREKTSARIYAATAQKRKPRGECSEQTGLQRATEQDVTRSPGEV
jgi:hypothetical protein